jgi:hypothetical protein
MKTKLIQIFKKSSYWLSVATLGIILGLSIQFTKAWTEPTAIAPNGNVGAPINTGDNSQYKAGALGIGKVLHGYSNAVFDGNVGIGTTSPEGYAKLDVNTTGSKAIHTMDTANGGLLMGYQGPSVQGRTTGDGNGNLYLNNFGGNVGIGTTTPGYKLDVNGSARIGNDLTVDNGYGITLGGKKRTSWPTYCNFNVLAPLVNNSHPSCSSLGTGWVQIGGEWRDRAPGEYNYFFVMCGYPC